MIVKLLLVLSRRNVSQIPSAFSRVTKKRMQYRVRNYYFNAILFNKVPHDKTYQPKTDKAPENPVTIEASIPDGSSVQVDKSEVEGTTRVSISDTTSASEIKTTIPTDSEPIVVETSAPAGTDVEITADTSEPDKTSVSVESTDPEHTTVKVDNKEVYTGDKGPTAVNVETKAEESSKDLTEKQNETSKIVSTNATALEHGAAFVLNTAADAVEVVSIVATSGMHLGKVITTNSIELAKDIAKEVLPKSSADDHIPGVISEALEITKDVAKLGADVIHEGIELITDVGSIIGETASDMINAGVESLTDSEENSPSSPATLAAQRLMNVTRTSTSEVFDSIGQTTSDILATTRDSASDLVGHTLGANAGKVVAHSLEIGKSVVDTVVKIKTFTPESVAKKSAAKATKLKPLVKINISKDD